MPTRAAPMLRRLTADGQAALGVNAFATAYGEGWELTVQAAVQQVEPFRA